MTQPSSEWLSQFNKTLVPEMFIRITYHASDNAAQADAIATADAQTEFSNVTALTDLDKSVSDLYATGETNLWVLDGSQELAPDVSPYKNQGFVSFDVVSNANHPMLILSFSKIHAESVPGITIVWSAMLNEFARSFKITAYKDSTLLTEKSVTDNDSVETDLDFEISGYNSIVLEIFEWNVPNHRARVEQIEIGRRIRFTKSDLLTYSHESKRDPISGQLSKDSISFSVDNSEQRWNPINPAGLYKYLYEQQEIAVQYGMDIDGQTEWISGGLFYLSGWNTPANGISASFEARDALVFLQNSSYMGRKNGTLYQMCYDALELLQAPNVKWYISDELKNYSADFSSVSTSYKNSDILQMAANAAGMALYQTRDGQIRIERISIDPPDKSHVFEISSMNCYDYPEITFSNKLKDISYSVNGISALYPKGATGDGVTQSVDNALLSDAIIEQPKNVLTESYKVLSNRRKATLTYRASPHNDAFDYLKLNHQFGYSSNLFVTDVQYTFDGCFKGTVTGYMTEDVDSLNIDATEVFVSPADTVTLTATLTPATVDSPVIIWSTYPTGIVDLSVIKNERGTSVCNVTYLHEGTATITATVSGLSATCTATTTANVLSDFTEGSIVKLTENGTWYEFVVAKHDYEPGLNETGNTLLVRKDSIANGIAWNSKVNTYANSTIDNYLNDNYKNALSSFVKGKLKKTTFYYTPGNGNKELTTLSRNVFLLSAKELVFDDWTDGQMWGKGCNGEGTLLPTAEQLVDTDVNDKAEYGRNAMWTRTPVYDARYFGIPSGHNTDSAVGVLLNYYSDGSTRQTYTNFIVSGTVGYCYRPAFTVPNNLKIGYDNRIEE